jgi:hypothetical protein
VERHYHPRRQITTQQARYNYSTFQREIRYGSIHLHVSHGKWLCLRKDPFWGNVNVRELLLKYRFEEHSTCHKSSCFKKGCELTFLFPFMSTTSTYIHEDEGEKKRKRNFVVFARWINNKNISVYCSTKKTHGLPVHQSTQFTHLEYFHLQYKHTNWRCITYFLQHIVH